MNSIKKYRRNLGIFILFSLIFVVAMAAGWLFFGYSGFVIVFFTWMILSLWLSSKLEPGRDTFKDLFKKGD